MNDPFKSHIRLNDQSLLASDIALMDLRYCPFIFLNACETGQSGGRTVENLEEVGDEQIGFVRAFTMAKSLSILVTAWKIRDDVATRFANCFYEVLPNSTTSEALKIARTKTWEEFKESSRDWAAYILYGNPFWRL